MKILPLNNLEYKNSINRKQPKQQYVVQKLNLNAADKVCFRAKPVLSELPVSKTLEKLYSPKYNFECKMDKDGNFITTIIDRATEKPVTVKVKPIIIRNNFERFELNIKRNWTGFEEKIGEIFYNICDNNFIQGYMKSFRNSSFEGIGIREHQILFERLSMRGIKSYTSESTPSAFAFHSKCGFEAIPSQEPDIIVNYRYETILNRMAKKAKMTPDEMKKIMVVQKSEDKYIIDRSLTYGNIAKYYILQNKSVPTSIDNIFIKLGDKAINDWEQRIKAQPIFGNIEIPQMSYIK